MTSRTFHVAGNLTDGPAMRRRLPPGHTERDMLELEARRGIHAGMLASNVARAVELDGVTGGPTGAENKMRGWTAQQPFHHVDCPVMHLCVLCGKGLEPDFLRDHKCRVALELSVPM